MSASPSFNCPWCGAPVSGPPGATFACPYCRANVTAPHPGLGAVPGRPPQPMPMHGSEADALFTADVDALVCTFAGGRFLLVGAHAPPGQPSRLRAVDPIQKAVVWEALQGEAWLAGLEASHIKALGPNVYVAHKRALHAFDPLTGARRWGAQLADKVDAGYDRAAGLAVVDPFPPGGRGAILVRTIDNGLHAFDRDTGQPLWSRSFGDKRFDMTAVEGQGAVVVRHGWPFVRVDVMNPAYAQPIASHPVRGDWSTDLGVARVSGRSVVTVVESYGADADQEGVLCFDAVTGQLHFFEQVDDLEDDDVSACAMGALVYAPTDDGGIWVGPRGRALPCPVPGHSVVSMLPAGPTLAVLCKKSQGTETRRVVGLDPATLGFRFDCGEAGSEPSDDWDEQMVTDGYSIVFVASPTDDDDACELRSVDSTSGRLLFRHPVGAWRGHAFLGGHVVAWSAEAMWVLAPANGKVVAQYP